MSYVIKATLLGIIPEEPEPVTVCFPIPDEQYDRTIDRLSQARMDHATSTNCTVSKLDSGYSVLAPLKGALVNVDQLDYLAKRLDSFDEGEAAQFQAMACKMSIRSLKDFINLTFCCQRATVIADFNDLEQAGRDHRMNLNGGVLSAEEAKLLDGRKEALQLIQSGAGTITPFGVVYDNGMRLEQLYDGKHFPPYLYDAYPLVLEASSKQAPEEKPEYLYLPATQRQIERALCRAGVTSGADLQLQIVMNQLPEQTAAALDLADLTSGDLPSLNQMCRAIKPLALQDRQKLDAAVQMAQPQDADEVRFLAENLEQFTFVPGIQSPKEYGEYLVKESGEFCYDEKLEGLYDYPQCGLRRLEEEKGQFSSLGYIAYRGSLTLEELMREDPAEQYQREQALQMGGPV